MDMKCERQLLEKFSALVAELLDEDKCVVFMGAIESYGINFEDWEKRARELMNEFASRSRLDELKTLDRDQANND